METKQATRKPVECPHCSTVADVPAEWLGEPTVCLYCDTAFRAIQTLPALPTIPCVSRLPIRSEEDCRGGLVLAMMVVGLVWGITWMAILLWY